MTDDGTLTQRFSAIGLGLLLGWLPCADSVMAGRLVDHFPAAAESGCMACHGEIEPIREPESEMMRQIMTAGEAIGDPAGCVVCHGGNADERKDVEVAHGGDFYPDP